jgi:Carboxypeptidase regulatory-like domain/TonB dependent receptor-like, beta-barrel
MPRHIPVLVAVSFLGVTVVTPAEIDAQTTSVPPTAQIGRQASMREGRIKGIVRDDVGQAVRGVSVVAMGTILASVRSDERGQFSLALPPGEYILRATCDGYLSTYREPVRVQTSASLQRDITLTRLGLAPVQPVLLASTAGASTAGAATTAAGSASTTPAPPGETPPGEHAHTEAAWRLRHLTRSILRDGPVIDDDIVSAQNRNSFQPRPSFFGRAVESSARVASAFFTDTNFDGQVNFLTTSIMSATSGLPIEWPRGIASIAVGAPVGRHGDWRMRGAITAGDASTWVLVGEYQAHAEATHAFRVGVSYSAQGYDPQMSTRWSAATTDAKNVAGVYGFDRWSVGSFVALDYGVRLDRYDYVASPNLVSPEIGMRLDLFPRTYARVQAARWMIAPGADEFLPPVSSGPWVPPERTFSSLVPNVAPRVEEVRHYEFGLGHHLGGRADRTIYVRRFHQSSANQIATLFGIDAASDVGHYYVATPGNVELDGWGARVATRFARRDRRLHGGRRRLDPRPPGLGRAPRRAICDPPEPREHPRPDEHARRRPARDTHANHAGLSHLVGVQSAGRGAPAGVRRADRRRNPAGPAVPAAGRRPPGCAGGHPHPDARSAGARRVLR